MKYKEIVDKREDSIDKFVLTEAEIKSVLDPYI